MKISGHCDYYLFIYFFFKLIITTLKLTEPVVTSCYANNNEKILFSVHHNRREILRERSRRIFGTSENGIQVRNLFEPIG